MFVLPPQGDVWICMEVMEASLDQFYKKLKAHGERIPEGIMKKIAKSVSESSSIQLSLY